MRYRSVHRSDANHQVILDALKRVTWVFDIHHFGGGMGDLIARHLITKRAVFIEIKAKQSDKLTEAEQVFAREMRASWVCVHDIGEALVAVGAII